MANIELKDVCKKIKDVEILKNISISFESGKIYGLKGKNGCGKTMLMRVVSGLIYPTSGEVFIDNRKLHVDMSFPESIGALIENPAFLPNYSGYDNLKLLAKLNPSITDEDIELALERVKLTDEKDKLYRKYSLGMKQKLGIANAIMGEPDIIILDEPINALDEESVNAIKDVLIEIRNKNKTIIIACHDREELEFLSDYIFLIKEGQCVGGFEVAK